MNSSKVYIIVDCWKKVGAIYFDYLKKKLRFKLLCVNTGTLWSSALRIIRKKVGFAK